MIAGVDFLRNLVGRFPQLEEDYECHVEDNGDPLPHVFFWDVTEAVMHAYNGTDAYYADLDWRGVRMCPRLLAVGQARGERAKEDRDHVSGVHVPGVAGVPGDRLGRVAEPVVVVADRHDPRTAAPAHLAVPGTSEPRHSLGDEDLDYTREPGTGTGTRRPFTRRSPR